MCRWKDIWQGGLKPNQRFDCGRAPPVLHHLVAERGVLHVAERTVFVPGCGRGYDVYALAKLGANVTGMELYEDAVRGLARCTWAASSKDQPSPACWQVNAALVEKERSNLGAAASRANIVQGRLARTGHICPATLCGGDRLYQRACRGLFRHRASGAAL